MLTPVKGVPEMEGQREGRPAAGQTRRLGCKTTGAPVKGLRRSPGAGIYRKLPKMLLTVVLLRDANEDRMRRRGLAVANAPVDKSIP